MAQQFKTRHLEAEKPLGFSLLPLFMSELIANGLDISHVNGIFYQEIAEELFKDDGQEIQMYAIDAMILLGQSIPLPTKTAEPPPPLALPKKVIKYEAKIENNIITTDHLTDIPEEDDEGDPLYTPPEDRINLRPEDCAPMEYDEDFCARIGATKDRR